MSTKLTLEAYVARPPTRKCREVIAVLEEAVQRNPDQLRLVVFERGAPWQEEPCGALKTAVTKGSGVPLCFVAGKFLIGGDVPTLEDVEIKVAEVLRARQRWGR